MLFAGPADDPDGIVADASVYHQARAALEDRSPSFGEFLRSESLVLRADLLRPWSNWVTLKESAPAAMTPTSSWVRCRRDSGRTGRTPNPTRQVGPARRQPLRTSRGGPCLLLPPTWSQLDSLSGRTVPEVLALERRIDKVQPKMTVLKDNWEIEFFDSDRYNEARHRAALRMRGRD